jgi:hypothetical protein
MSGENSFVKLVVLVTKALTRGQKGGSEYHSVIVVACVKILQTRKGTNWL